MGRLSIPPITHSDHALKASHPMARSPSQSSRVLLSALADESAFNLTAVEQFTALAAIGLE